MARVIVDVMPKPEILDPQGKAVHRALPLLGLTAASAIPKNQQDDDCCPVGGTLTPPYVSACGYYESSAKRPDQHFPPSLSPKITPNDLCFITNLELPPSAAGKTCTLKLLLPTQQQAHQWYQFSGPGHFNFTGYATGVGADDTTTYNHQPAPGPSKLPSSLSPKWSSSRI